MPDIEEIPLPNGGSIPGIGGGPLGPGRYCVNWIERTIKLIEEDLMPSQAVPLQIAQQPVTQNATAEVEVKPEAASVEEATESEPPA